jgi:hypothetical protein
MTPHGKDSDADCHGNRDKATVEELLLIAASASAGCSGPFMDHAEFLFDDYGLPK